MSRTAHVPAPHPAASPAPGAPVVRRPPSPRVASSTVTRLRMDASCEETVATSSVQGTLALDLTRTPAPSPRPHLVAVPSPDGVDEVLRTWAGRFAQAVVEVTGGDRPVTQLLRWTSPRVYADLSRRVQIMAHTRPVAQRQRTIRPQVRSVHVFQPVPTGAEVAVHVRHGRRSRAIAARLELRSGHWTCTDLRIG